MSISQNISSIKQALPQNITLVAVSKTKHNTAILEAYETGHRDFGENYVQELVDKQAQLPKDINWHFIGHLQSNKVKYIAQFVHLIHGVDSFNLLKEIDKQAQKNNRIINCLLQIFIAKEETKFGFDFKEAEQILLGEEIKSLKNVAIKGFMGMASNSSDTGQVEGEFNLLYEFQQKMLRHLTHLTILSTGMSGDYDLAVKNGSNMVRIGSKIFGERV